MILPGVDISNIQTQIGLALGEARPIFANHGLPLIITSCRDGVHMRGSLHFVGAAVDLRINHAPRDKWEIITDQIRLSLGWPESQFDVLLETDPDHIHIEFQPKE